jgi:AraC-like DNA-binding protein
MEFVEIDMESVAHQLNMTVRTLRRKLDDEGTGFQDIKDELRRDTALHLLNQSSLSIQSISQQLGFSETAAFTRSFKKWTGQTPRAFRTGQI